jgi:hypothetical protein
LKGLQSLTGDTQTGVIGKALLLLSVIQTDPLSILEKRVQELETLQDLNRKAYQQERDALDETSPYFEELMREYDDEELDKYSLLQAQINGVQYAIGVLKNNE